MGFILDLSTQMWVASLLNTSQSVFRGPPAPQSTELFEKNLNSQAPLVWPPGSECSGLEPRNLHSNPSPGDSDPQQSFRSICNGGRCGEELIWVVGSIKRREWGPRSQEGADHELTPTFFSNDSPHNLAWPYPQELAAGRSCQNRARVSFCWP